MDEDGGNQEPTTLFAFEIETAERRRTVIDSFWENPKQQEGSRGRRRFFCSSLLLSTMRSESTGS